MKFSSIIGKAYHQILLSMDNQELVDIYFTASSHHYYRCNETLKGSEIEEFHIKMFKRHLWAFMEIIYENGDFSIARDPTGLDLHIRKNWNPSRSKDGIPDPLMFNSMKPDSRYTIGYYHPNDEYLEISDIKVMGLN